ncbi:hypothetical protein ACTWPB_18570 [Nocardia sp. IBHARD005]|uniref:hypothetical protein n=1 Tax=Nocardia sp. IBHARD005 TaxID=3457765 RepID=UPI004059516B
MLILLLALSSALVNWMTASGRGTVRMFVAAEQVDCQGVAPMRCMQVRVDPVENPPADHSSLRYDLIQVEAKTPA